MRKNTCQEYENSRELFFEALRKKNRQAEDCFYKLGFNKIVPMLRQKKVSLDDAQDLLHDGIVAFYFRLDTLKPNAAPTTILYTIVHNKWVDRVRANIGRESLSDELPLASPEPSPLEKLLDTEMQQELRAAIAQLEPSSQRLMELLIFEEKKPEEVAQILNISRASVDNQKYRIIKYLRDKLKGGKKP